MKIIKSKTLLSLITLYFITYLLLDLLIIKNDAMVSSRVMAISGSFASIIVLLKLRDKTGDYKSFCTLILITSFVLFLGDMTRVYCQLYECIKLFDMSIYSLFYIICNWLILFSLCSLVRKKTIHWVRNILILDGIIFAILLSSINMYLILNNYLNSESKILLNSIFIICFIISDFLILFTVSILYQANENSKDKHQLLVFLLWSMIDIFYHYLAFNTHDYFGFDIYSILDIFWPTLLLCISYFLTLKVESNNINITEFNYKYSAEFIQSNKDIYKNIPFIFIVLYIIAIIMSFIMHFGKICLIIFLTILLIVRQIISNYIYTYEINKHLTYKYKVLSEDLELQVEKRTSELIKKNQELYKLANNDPLTSLPNRRNFVSKLDELIIKRKDSGTFALLFIDLDRFKSINDWYGHDVGDLLIIATAERLKYNMSPQDFVARQGGDEFVALIDNFDDLYEIIYKCQKLVNTFRIPFMINGQKISSSLSIGVSIFPYDGTTRVDLMKYADIALYHSKANGKNRYSLFDPSMNIEEDKKFVIENKLYDSITNNELELYFQPQVNISTENIVGVEALLRWKNKELGYITPSEFISIAEDTGFIINIGEWVLEESCRQIKYLNEKYNTNIKMGINVSPRQFLTSDLVKNVEKYIQLYDLDGSWIDIEITETCSIKNEENTIKILKDLKALGVNISIDDFGIGYSSLSYLKRYPVDTLKIAMELTRGIDTNIEDYKIVKAIISMCKDLNLNTIAEGVEEKIQVNILKELGCKEIQGYYYAKPMTLEEIEAKFLNNHKICEEMTLV